MCPRFCGGDIYSRRKPLFSGFGKHTAICGSSVRQAVARPSHRQSVFVAACHFLIIFYVAATCRPSVLGSATKTRPPVAKQSGQCARALKVFITRPQRSIIFIIKYYNLIAIIITTPYTVDSEGCLSTMRVCGLHSVMWILVHNFYYLAI